MSLALLLLLAAHAQDEAVVPLLAIERPPELEVPLLAPTPLLVHRLSVELRPGRPESQVELTAELEGMGGGWIDLPVAGAGLTIVEARLDGVPVALPPAEDGWRHLVTRARGRHRLTLTGLLPSPESGVALPMMSAARASLRVIAPGQDVRQAGRLLRGGRVDLAPGEALSLQWAPTSPPPPRPVVLVAESAVALRADAAGIEGRARLTWRVSGGSVQEVRFRMPGRTEALSLTGAGVRGFRQEGGLVIVSLEAPERDGVSIDLGFRGPPPADGAEAAPVPVPEAARATGWLTLLRGDESILIPAAGPGLEPVSARALPAAASGLLDGSVLATYQTAQSPSLTWRLSRYTPVDEPPTVVDDARYTLALTEVGRVVLRARYQVRNDRNQFLRLTLPPGYRCLGVRVSGRTVNAVADASGVLAIPLEKSVETLNGLVTFPVELLLIGEEPAWEARGARVLQSPALDAPIASARWELRLPAGVEVREVEGAVRRVEEWTGSEQAIQYGSAYTRGGGGDDGDEEAVEIDFASPRGQRRAARRAAAAEEEEEEGGERAAGQAAQDDTREQVSQELWNQAYDAYKTNEFSKADDLLQASIAADPTNIAAKSLQSNVNVLLGKDKASEGEVGARRVKDMARAKTGRAEVEQEKLLKEAEEQTRRGDYAAAESNYERLVEITSGLANVEQQESNEQKVNLSTITSSLSSLRSQRESAANSPVGGLQGQVAAAHPDGVTGAPFGDAIGDAIGDISGATTGEEGEVEPASPGFFGASQVDNGYIVDALEISDDERPAPPVESPEPVQSADQDAGIDDVDLAEPEVVYATEDLPETTVAAQAIVLESKRSIPISGRSYSTTVQSAPGVEGRERNKKIGGKGSGAGRAAPDKAPAAQASPAPVAAPAAPQAARPAEPARRAVADEKAKLKSPKSEAVAPQKPVDRPQSLADSLSGVEAFPLSIALPSALHPLRVEKELVAEGQPITITIRYRTRKDRP